MNFSFIYELVLMNFSFGSAYAFFRYYATKRGGRPETVSLMKVADIVLRQSLVTIALRYGSHLNQSDGVVERTDRFDLVSFAVEVDV